MNVALELRRRILTGSYGPGHRIPPERELEQEFGCSRITIARAMAPLVADGLIARFRGRGTYVLDRDESTAARPMQASKNRLPGSRGNIVKYISPAHQEGTRSSRDEVLSGLHSVLDPAGYHVSVDFYDGLEEHLSCLAKVNDPQIAGLVLWPFPHERTVEVVSGLIQNGIPLVLADTYLPAVDCDYVVTDNIVAAGRAVQHLAELGHRRISYVTLPIDRTSLRDRLSGFLSGIVEADLPITANSVVRLGGSVAGSNGIEPTGLANALDHLLSRPDAPTALFASHDAVALAIHAHLQSREFRVPDDISLVGYDGTEGGQFISSPLTTVKQDFREMAQIAARILLERFDGRSPALRYHSLINAKVTVRASSALPRGTEAVQGRRETIQCQC